MLHKRYIFSGGKNLSVIDRGNTVNVYCLFQVRLLSSFVCLNMLVFLFNQNDFNNTKSVFKLLFTINFDWS